MSDSEVKRVRTCVWTPPGDHPVGCGMYVTVKDNKVIVKKEVDNGYQMIEVDTPCVVTFTKPKWEPRLGTIKRLLAARRAEIKTISFDDVQETIDDTMIGLNGSPTRVKRTFVPQRNAGGIKIEGKTPEMAGRELATLLDEAKII